MKKNYFIGLMMLVMLFSLQTNAQVDVTIRVDMSAETVSANGVHVAGTINGWSTDATMLTEEGITGIYAVTVQLTEGWHRYKFLNGSAWGEEESASYPCAPTNGDRFIYVNNSGLAVILEPVPFNGCNPSGTGFEVTFNVDMASAGSIVAGNVHMVGWHTDWNPENLSFPNATGDIHSGMLRLPSPADYPITFEYKYLSAAGWGNDETPGPEATCATVTGNNRLITVNNSGANIYDVFNACNYVLSTEDFIANSLKIVYNKTERMVNFFSEGLNNKISQIQVFDITGKSIKTIEGINSISDISIDFQSQTNGIYFVRVESSDKQLVKKVMVY
ncbi:MAG: T9SS type A sorting domain-containing protein [Winogradskyella sp.]|uniref:T9SS type A sorting domain-containing protein n=1 Tax=Winogradskyella sp. TaxID=1883156 RepID=UPI001822E560|nr:T9SS type A sorting domain-containing protein [Winogradskyella sp.]MBT8243684.1 T9SS type A sorting domain-containing protein [Winogradskyella sp.]NNK23280.1 T9SS type A sorting domain-containing protein [Winogradskyella sp.]